MTGLSPKTVRKHLRWLRAEGVATIVPRLGALRGAGDVVFHVAVQGDAPLGLVRRALGDVYVANELAAPPLRYLLCRADDLADAMLRVQALTRVPGVVGARPTYNREILVDTAFVHALVAEASDRRTMARVTPSGVRSRSPWPSPRRRPSSSR